MDLLPRTREEFSQPSYWDTFFEKRGTKSFEWYGEWVELCDQIYKYAKPGVDKILMLGCGNSRMSIDMHAQGYRDITNIDISPVAIKRMNELCKSRNIDMKFEQMDATAMTFEDASFSVALDKGTLDALFSNDSEEVRATVERYFKEVTRVLRTGGRYLCISLLQEHILKYLVDFLPRHSFMVRIVHCQEARCYEKENSEADDEPLPMPVFMVVATKFKALPMPILEFSFNTEKMQRLKDVKELVEAVASLQRAAMVCNGLGRDSIAGHKEVQLDLYQTCSGTGDNATTTPRYTVHVLDQPFASKLGRYAVFIVPQGREIEWLFGTPAGRLKLQQTANYERLAIVTMHRDQEYGTLDDVKSELTNSVRMLSPIAIKTKIPYLSLGTDVGKRETLVSGLSQISGEFRIEEVDHEDGKVFRRLIFLSNQAVVQSEALVKIIKPKGKKERKKIDVGYLACQHHLYMSVAVQFVAGPLTTQQPIKPAALKDVLVVGLGGGGLCSFLHEAFPQVSVTAVEIDPIMLEVAEQYFELKQDKRLHVVIDDGLAFLEQCKREGIQFDAILFDVDSKDSSLGMSCPPRSFLAPEVLENVKHALRASGLFVLNLVCRDETLRVKALDELRQVFGAIASYKLEEDINEVIYCASVEMKPSNWRKATKQLSDALASRKLTSADILDATSFLKDLQI